MKYHFFFFLSIFITNILNILVCFLPYNIEKFQCFISHVSTRLNYTKSIHFIFSLISSLVFKITIRNQNFTSIIFKIHIGTSYIFILGVYLSFINVLILIY